MAASDTGCLAHFVVVFEKESICMSWKLNDAKMFVKIFMMFLKGGRGSNKMSLHFSMNKSSFEWPL